MIFEWKTYEWTCFLFFFFLRGFLKYFFFFEYVFLKYISSYQVLNCIIKLYYFYFYLRRIILEFIKMNKGKVGAIFIHPYSVFKLVCSSNKKKKTYEWVCFLFFCGFFKILFFSIRAVFILLVILFIYNFFYLSLINYFFDTYTVCIELMLCYVTTRWLLYIRHVCMSSFFKLYTLFLSNYKICLYVWVFAWFLE